MMRRYTVREWEAKPTATRTLTNIKPFMSAEYAKENKQNKLTALQVTHTEWIYRCILVHNCKSGTMVNLNKTELLVRGDYESTLPGHGKINGTRQVSP
jgi:hypothetical protein